MLAGAELHAAILSQRSRLRKAPLPMSLPLNQDETGPGIRRAGDKENDGVSGSAAVVKPVSGGGSIQEALRTGLHRVLQQRQKDEGDATGGNFLEALQARKNRS